MNLLDRIEAFRELGKRLKNLPPEQLFGWSFEAEAKNRWFTAQYIKNAISSAAYMLEDKQLEKWSSNYKYQEHKPLKVGVVMAGNIPMAGFHDFLAVLFTGNILHAKLSAQDDVLLKKVTAELIEINPEFDRYIVFADMLKNMDAVIATGSDNTARYFKFYFSNIPNIIRSNRNSVAVLSGKESEEELIKLGEDIFLYFGLGCRNVSKLFVPEEYSFDKLFKAIEKYRFVTDHNKYLNNYEYQKAVFLLNKVDHLDNGFLLIREDQQLATPVSVVYYEKYKNVEQVKSRIAAQQEKIQVVLSENAWFEGSEAFGLAQRPGLMDYPDNVDTVKFLLDITNK